MTTRDAVHFESTERADLPDVNVMQSNARSYAHLPWRWFLYDLSNPTPNFVLQGFEITEDSPASSQVIIANGIGTSAITLEDGSTVEHGVFFGQEGPSSQALDFSGQPVAVYNVYARCSYDTGQQGNRMFWNDLTELEEAANIDTRFVFGWDVAFGTVSPGDEWQKIGEVDWDGATVVTADITMTRRFFFEGDESTGFGYTWGGGSDRSADRAANGVFSEKAWQGALRTQLKEIIDASGDWWDAPQADLAETRAHIDQDTDAHSDSPTWTGTVTIADLVVDEGSWDSARNFVDVVPVTTLQYVTTQPGLYSIADGITAINWQDSTYTNACTQENVRQGRLVLGDGIVGYTVGDYLYIPVNELMRYGCTLTHVYINAQTSPDDTATIVPQLYALAWTGSGAVVPTALGSAGTGMVVVEGDRGTYTSSGLNYTVPGFGDAGGQKDYFIRLSITARVSAGAPALIFELYNVALRWTATNFRHPMHALNA